MSSNTFVGPNCETKQAYVWIAMMFGGFFGADLFFSSHEAFKKLHNGGLKEGELLHPILVPIEFDDWDYIPENY